jgi:hypothetical protein
MNAKFNTTKANPIATIQASSTQGLARSTNANFSFVIASQGKKTDAI